MRKLLLGLGLWVGLIASASAQVPCVGVGGVNSVPQVGISCFAEPLVATYGAVSIGVAPASSATDFACIAGAAGKVIRLQRLKINGTAGTLINIPATIVKRASLDTGGTPATTTGAPVAYSFDSSNTTASAVLVAYTANPTIVDSSPGYLDTGILVLTATGTLAGSTGLVFDWINRNYMEAPTLRKATEQICVNLNATSPSSGVVNTIFQWTEAAQ